MNLVFGAIMLACQPMPMQAPGEQPLFVCKPFQPSVEQPEGEQSPAAPDTEPKEGEHDL